MSDLQVTVDSTLWVEKYKPKSIDEVLCEQHLKDKFVEFIAKGDIPNLIFPGNAGNGKTTTAKLIAKAIAPDDTLFINASNESGVDIVRNKIIPFCSTMTMSDSDTKVVILDEMEMSSENFQTSLRAVIEDFYTTTRFILTCNFYNKVIEPLKSRTQEFRFGDISQKDILKRCFAILDTEEVKYDKKNVAKVLKHLGTDMRRIVNTLQKLTVDKDGGRVLSPFTSDEEKLAKMLDFINKKNLTGFRKFVSEQNMNVEQIATFIFNQAFNKKFGKTNWVEMITVMGECIDRLKGTVNPEITLVHHVLQLMQLID
jgi:DNA polymerase III delta prime subunit